MTDAEEKTPTPLSVSEIDDLIELADDGLDLHNPDAAKAFRELRQLRVSGLLPLANRVLSEGSSDLSKLSADSLRCLLESLADDAREAIKAAS